MKFHIVSLGDVLPPLCVVSEFVVVLGRRLLVAMLVDLDWMRGILAASETPTLFTFLNRVAVPSNGMGARKPFNLVVDFVGLVLVFFGWRCWLVLASALVRCEIVGVAIWLSYLFVAFFAIK